MKITLQHLADLLKLSRATVSLALRDDERINEKTRARVQALALELDYQPNQAAASLRTQISRNIWVIISSIEGKFDRDLLNELTKYFTEYGYDCFVVFHLEDSDRYDRLIKKLLHSLADGAVIVPRRLVHDFGILKNIPLRGFPSVLVDVDVSGLGLSLITSDPRPAIFEMVTSCLQKGCENFIISSPLDNSVSRSRFGAFKDAISTNGCLRETDDIDECFWKSLDSESPFVIISDSQEGILCFSERWSSELLGREFYFICFDEWLGSVAPAKGVYVSSQNAKSIAHGAVQQLLSIIRKELPLVSDEGRIHSTPHLPFTFLSNLADV